MHDILHTQQGAEQRRAELRIGKPSTQFPSLPAQALEPPLLGQKGQNRGLDLLEPEPVLVKAADQIHVEIATIEQKWLAPATAAGSLAAVKAA
jgi:hypothetical protein